MCEFVFECYYWDKKYTRNYEPLTFEVSGKIYSVKEGKKIGTRDSIRTNT